VNICSTTYQFKFTIAHIDTFHTIMASALLTLKHVAVGILQIPSANLACPDLAILLTFFPA